MSSATTDSPFKYLPSTDEVLRSDELSDLARLHGQGWLACAARASIEELRSGLGAEKDPTRERLYTRIIDSIKLRARGETRTGIQKVINATGVVIHTNLGRAPLSDDAKRALIDAAEYCNLEYDLDLGSRGLRGSRAEKLICQLTGAESATIVNNCAAAAFLVLSAFARDAEVIVSRGEMVEIGGDFRIPDVLMQSGATLREVGTTNRTKLSDYEKAIGERTRLILRVHPSNYRIIGFTAKPELTSLSELAKKHSLLLYEDIGSGALQDLAIDEPVVGRSIADGVDIVTFSGDKLLGGPQAGMIAGRKDLIDKLRKHPLYRILRADKLCYAALEATLRSYATGQAQAEIPVARMLAATALELEKRCRSVLSRLSNPEINAGIIEGASAVGGGAAAGVSLPTTLISLKHTQHSASKLEYLLRNSTPPIIARIENDAVLLDLRTMSASDEKTLCSAVNALR